jgi:hypothetical protein
MRKLLAALGSPNKSRSLAAVGMAGLIWLVARLRAASASRR